MAGDQGDLDPDAASSPLVAFPLGIACAVYLEEYSSKSRFAKWTRINVRNLAGVPSIVYGLLGLAIFVKALVRGHQRQDDLRRRADARCAGVADRDHHGVGGTPRRARAASVKVRSASAQPSGRRCGITSCPSAAPGILTGTVLALARAAGEAAPILLVGAATGLLVTGSQNFFEQLTGSFTAMPAVIYSFARQPGEDFRAITAAASVVLLVLVLLMNGFAVWLRNRYERKW